MVDPAFDELTQTTILVQGEVVGNLAIADEADESFDADHVEVEKNAVRPPLPEGWVQEKRNRRLFTVDADGKPRCAAWKYKKQEYCHRHPSEGRNRCRFHGGESPRGIASPHFKNGENSIDMPARLMADYQAALNDPELVSMRQQIAFMKARELDLYKRLDTGESGALWKLLKKTHRKLMDALREKDEADSQFLMGELGRIIHQGYNDYLAWQELTNTQEHGRKMKESERKRLVDMNQVVYTEQMMGVIAALTDSLRRHVHDREALAAVSNDIRRLLEGNKAGNQ